MVDDASCMSPDCAKGRPRPGEGAAGAATAEADVDPPPVAACCFEGVEPDRALRAIFEGTAAETGERFFPALVKSLSDALRTDGAWVTEYEPAARKLRALAFWHAGRFQHGYEYVIDGTPCEPVIAERRLVHIPDRIVELYPGDNGLEQMGAVSYLGIPLFDAKGEVMGHLSVLDSRPIPARPGIVAVLRTFAARATAELARLHAERALRAREHQLSSVLTSAMDAIVELDGALAVALWNAAAARVFGRTEAEARGQPATSLFEPESAARLAALSAELAAGRHPEAATWVAGGLVARRAGGGTFAAEATLARGERWGEPFFTLVLRDVEDRLAAERRIATLAREADVLRAELGRARGAVEALGESPAMRRVLADVAEVAPTDATVLLTGETGTGKSLLARAIHAASPRRDRPLVELNCAAIPRDLVESELFGHEQGAFTGATRRREGRFTLADGGTIFLDEVGELPLELQPKLLRVLQAGELEPVGSARTRKVSVRVIAATNRDLEAAVRAGAFRSDLYYRLHVFPIAVPPLRERREDLPSLAESFARRFAARLGKRVAPLDEAALRRLAAYGWPGNVRELENVIERAVITARGGALDLARALPEAVLAEPALPEPACAAGTSAGASARASAGAGALAPGDPGRILTAGEMDALIRQNLLRALDAAGWKVAGADGAAALLGLPPSTLASRMKSLGIRKADA